MNFKTQKFKKENNSKFSLLFIIACLSVLIIPFVSVLFSVNASGFKVETIYGDMVRTSIDALYIDPEGEKGGSDANDGTSPTTPIQTIERAKELISPTGIIYIMSGFEITQDSIIDMGYPTVEFRRYNDPSTGYITDNLFTIGSSSDATITPNVVFKNFKINGIEKTSSLTARVIEGYNCNLILEKSFSIVNITGEWDILYLTNSKVVFLGCEIDNNQTNLNMFRFASTQCIINDIVFTRNKLSGNATFYVNGNSPITINGGQFGGFNDINSDGVCDEDESLGNVGNSDNYILFRVGAANITVNGGDFSYNENVVLFNIPDFNTSTDNYFKDLIINGGNFHNNTISLTASGKNVSSLGVIVNGGGNVEINGGVFENNSNVNAGGVISFGVGNLVITGGTFRNNSAAVGGAIYCNLVQDENKTKESFITISNATFSDNVATGSFVPSSSLILDLAGTIEGGSVIFTTQNLTISNCIFNGNVVQNNGTGGTIGGAIVYKLNGSDWAGVYGRKTRIYIYDSSFIGNSNEQVNGAHGAVLSILSYVGGEVSNCLFEENTSALRGGVVCSVEQAFVFRDCQFIENSAQTSGAIDGSGSFYNCSFIGNKAAQMGGAIVTTIVYLNECTFEENYSGGEGGAIYNGQTLTISNTKITNNIAVNNGAGVMETVYGNANTYIYGTTSVSGNRIGAQVDENNDPVLQDGQLIGGTENNMCFTDGYNYLWLLNVENTSGETIGFTITRQNRIGEQYTAISIINTTTMSNKILDSVVSDDPDYKFVINSSGDGLSYIDINNNEDNTINYTAESYIGWYDGNPHSIEVNVFNLEEANITYSLDEDGTYSAQNPTFIDIGNYTVYYKIEASGYTTISGNRQIKILQNTTNLVDYANNDINHNSYLVSATNVNLYYGENLTTSSDITDRFNGGIIRDMNGNTVVGTFTSNGNYNVTFATQTINVLFTPTNSSYSTCTFTANVVIEYDELYFANDSFYLVSDLSGVSIPRSEGLDEIVLHLKDNAIIYFMDTYDVSGSEVIKTDKNIRFARYSVLSSGQVAPDVYAGEIFNIPNGATLRLGTNAMLGKIIVDGQGNGSNGSRSALIVNNGTLYVYGDIEITNGYNTNSSSSGIAYAGGGLYNNGSAYLQDTRFLDCRYLNWTSASSYDCAGGGIYNTGLLEMTNCYISNCISLGGAGLFSNSTRDVVLTDCYFFKNYGHKALSSSIANVGLVVKILSGNVEFVNCYINENGLTDGAGHYYTTNFATTILGGGIYVGSGAEITLITSRISKCYANSGAGIYVDGTATLISTGISSCRATGTGCIGGGIVVGSSGHADILSSHIENNTVEKSSGDEDKDEIYAVDNGEITILSIGTKINDFSGNIENYDGYLTLYVIITLLVLVGVITTIFLVKRKKR